MILCPGDLVRCISSEFGTDSPLEQRLPEAGEIYTISHVDGRYLRLEEIAPPEKGDGELQFHVRFFRAIPKPSIDELRRLMTAVEAPTTTARRQALRRLNREARRDPEPRRDFSWSRSDIAPSKIERAKRGDR